MKRWQTHCFVAWAHPREFDQGAVYENPAFSHWLDVLPARGLLSFFRRGLTKCGVFNEVLMWVGLSTRLQLLHFLTGVRVSHEIGVLDRSQILHEIFG